MQDADTPARPQPRNAGSGVKRCGLRPIPAAAEKSPVGSQSPLLCYTTRLYYSSGERGGCSPAYQPADSVPFQTHGTHKQKQVQICTGVAQL